MKNLFAICLLALAFNSFAQIPSYVPTNGLVGYWPFTGNANDVSGNGNNGTVSGATLTTDRFGNANDAYDFDGITNKITLPPNSNIQGNNPRTISSWFTLNNLSNHTHTLYKGGANGLGYDFSIWIICANNQVKFQIRRYTDDIRTNYFNIPINQWHSLIVTYDGTNDFQTKIYLDGQLITNFEIAPTGLTYNTAPTTPEFGHLTDQQGDDHYMIGKLDDIGIWDRALTAQEITSLSNSNTNSCGLINSVTLTANPQGPSLNSYIGVGYTAYNKALVTDSTQWHYVVVTKAANLQTKTYIDGQLLIDTLFQNLPYSYSSLYIGAGFLTSFNSFFKGNIDEFRMSNVVRTPTEIQTYYNSNAPFSADLNTIGLWHFDEANGATTFSNSAAPTSGTLTNNPQFTNGKFGNAVYFNGINQHGNCNLNIPENNITFEFWFKSNSLTSGVIAQAYGSYNTSIAYEVLNGIAAPLTWSTGDTSSSITVNPNALPYVWLSNGSCTDTIFFNSQSASIYDTTYVTISDTNFVTITDTNLVTIIDTNFVTVTDTNFVTITDTNYISVTDTLIINALLTGLNPPNNTNTLMVYPNPSSDHITIDYGNFNLMSGYTLKIENAIGQTVFTTPITQQQSYIDLSSWSGNGIYFVHVIDGSNNTIDIRKIVLQ
jgi:hypothetical protein